MTFSLRTQWFIGLILAGFVVLTRSHHFASLHHLPDASWAVFLLAGFYLPRWLSFASLFALCVLLDFIALTFGTGDNSACFTVAYGLLLPAYASLWWAGRWYGAHYQPNGSTLAALAMAMVAGTLACDVFSSGGYYLFSGEFQPNWTEYGQRFRLYYPAYLISTLGYVVVAGVLHTALSMTVKFRSATSH
jgi:hypothetical protein